MDCYQNQQRDIGEGEDQSKFYIESIYFLKPVSQLPQILQESRKFALKFIDELKEKALTPISQDVLDHYHGHIKSNYASKDIINIIDKRIAKMIRNKKIKKNWNLDDIVALLWFVSKYINVYEGLNCENLGKEDWEFISRLIPGSSARGCMFKFISLKKVKLSLFNWSEQEESMLKDLVMQISSRFRKFGQDKWKEISESLYQNIHTSKVFRTSKQCRQHWNCYLDPKLKKGPWSQSQDLKLLENVIQNKGERKWSSIKYLFEGRTQNALKNRYNLLLERQRKLTPDLNESQLVRQYLKLKGSTFTSVDPSANSHSNEVQQEAENSQLPQQIFEEALEDSKQKMTEVEIKKQQSPQIFMKSQKSSFKLSKTYQKSQIGLQNIQERQQDPSNKTLKSCMPVNVGGISSIITNQQGFYTNITYRVFYSA